jgi:hypothetical protein
MDLTNKKLINEQELKYFIVWTKHDANKAWNEIEAQGPQLALKTLKDGAFKIFT